MKADHATAVCFSISCFVELSSSQDGPSPEWRQCVSAQISQSKQNSLLSWLSFTQMLKGMGLFQEDKNTHGI